MSENRVRLQFLGAIGTVTGSCTLLEYTPIDGEKTYYMIDIGEYQGEHLSSISENKRRVLSWAKRVRGLFLTHAHLDHIGLLPDFIKAGFMGTVYCTKATRDLTKIMLTDAAKIKEESPVDFEKIRFCIPDEREDFEFRHPISLTHDFFFSVWRSSHILGSCAWRFHWTKKDYPENTALKDKEWLYIYFSGDIGPVDKNSSPNIMFRGRHAPYHGKEKRFIILESTYGGRPPREKNTDGKTVFDKRIEKLVEILNKYRDYSILVPAFALNRSQELLLDLYYIQFTQKVPLYSKDIKVRRVEKNETLKKSLKRDNQENPEKRKVLEEIWQKYKPNETLDENFLYKDMPDAMQEEILAVDNKYDQRPKDFLLPVIESPLIEKINTVYLENLAARFKSTEKNDSGYKYKYLAKDFLATFGLGKENSSTEQICAVENILQKALFLKESRYSFEKDFIKRKNCIFISASGMCDEGKIVTLLPLFLKDEKAVILLTGYQAQGTNGFHLRKLSRDEYTDDEKFNKKITLPTGDIRLWDIKCTIIDLSVFYSGHADQEQLVDYVVWDDPKHPESIQPVVFLNHGTDEARMGLKQAIEEKDRQRLAKPGSNPNPITVFLPEINIWYNLNRDGEADPAEPEETAPDLIEFVSSDTVITLSFRDCEDLCVSVPVKYEHKLPEISRFFREQIIFSDDNKKA
ncbi:MAG: MBL fold metallo-hydrolase [Spirochaetaceae bacterium]|jgi:Cft2 family RNA processing exonuclease|nr:MBL fold metallo-hydrolase [Spirochaetaceae bacterium]